MINKSDSTTRCSHESIERDAEPTVPDPARLLTGESAASTLFVAKSHDTAVLNARTPPSIKQFWKEYKVLLRSAPKPDRASYYFRSLMALRTEITFFLASLFLLAFYVSLPKSLRHSAMLWFLIPESVLCVGTWISGFLVSGPQMIRGILYPASWFAETFDRFAKREDYIVRVLRERYFTAVRKSMKLRVKQGIDLAKGRLDAAGVLSTLLPVGAIAISALLFASDLPVLGKGILSLLAFLMAVFAVTSKLGFVDLQEMVFLLERAEDEDKKGRDTWGNNGSD